MATLASGTTLYLTPAQFLNYFDTRAVAELLSDTGTKITDVVNDATLAELLKSACGEVEASALRGGRYSSADLAQIAASATHGAGFLRQLCSDCTMNLLRQRRGRVGEEALEAYKKVERQLKTLREGETIFGVVEVQEAANLSSQRDDRPTRILRRGISEHASRFFGTRGGDERT